MRFPAKFGRFCSSDYLTYLLLQLLNITIEIFMVKVTNVQVALPKYGLNQQRFT